MLQQKRNKGLSPECIKLFFIIGGIIAGFFTFFTWILIILYFSYEKNISKIKVLSLGDILRFSGFIGCLNNLGNNLKIKKEDYKRIEKYYKEKKVFKKETFYDKKYKKKKTKPDFSYSKNKESILDKKINFETNSYSKTKIDFSPSKKIETNLKQKKIFSNKYNSFNSGKSIWDDYESVIDIMNKNK